jgi:hypothetical protein
MTELEDTWKYKIQVCDNGFITEKKTRILKTILNMSVSFIEDLQAYCSWNYNVRYCEQTKIVGGVEA